MLILITYDVNTETPLGKKRLRQVAKVCVNYGQRVQNSVFECVLDWSQFAMVQNTLKTIIDPSIDSIRYYNLGNKHEGKVIHVGAKPSIDIEGTLVM